MEALAKEDMVLPLFDELHARYGDDLMVICYMNTSGRLKALAGRTGGAVCTSSNAKTIMQWAIGQNKKIFFIPDQHLGRNCGRQVGIFDDETFLFGAGWAGAQTSLAAMSASEKERLDKSRLLLWGSYCGVHTVFQTSHVKHWQSKGYKVLVHPECTVEVVEAADGAGSTKYLWSALTTAKRGDKLAIGTEGTSSKTRSTTAKNTASTSSTSPTSPARASVAAARRCRETIRPTSWRCSICCARAKHRRSTASKPATASTRSPATANASTPSVAHRLPKRRGHRSRR